MQSDQCVMCAHYTGTLTCTAFPEGIPEAIVTGEHDHSEPYEGDKGIRWAPFDPANLPELPEP